MYTVPELELAKARRAIEHFIYSCSNTLREPLKSLARLVALIRNDDENEGELSRRYLDAIEKTIFRMESVINDMQEFLAHSHNTITVRSVNVGPMIKDILHDFEDVIASSGVKISVTTDQQIPFYTDQTSFRMILSQLVSNAIIFQDDNKADKQINIRVSVDKFECKVIVEDNGIGIDKSNIADIFKLFFRAQHERAGSGVGLFIAHELAAALGGQIDVASQSGEGASFSFSLDNLWAPEQPIERLFDLHKM